VCDNDGSIKTTALFVEKMKNKIKTIYDTDSRASVIETIKLRYCTTTVKANDNTITVIILGRFDCHTESVVAARGNERARSNIRHISLDHDSYYDRRDRPTAGVSKRFTRTNARIIRTEIIEKRY
jgi:hypothetical protein